MTDKATSEAVEKIYYIALMNVEARKAGSDRPFVFVENVKMKKEIKGALIAYHTAKIVEVVREVEEERDKINTARGMGAYDESGGRKLPKYREMYWKGKQEAQDEAKKSLDYIIRILKEAK